MMTTNGKQVSPSYTYGYHGGKFRKVTVCKDCGRTACYEDQHHVRPCPDCGGKVEEKVGRWVRATYRTDEEVIPKQIFFGLINYLKVVRNKVLVKEAHWEIKG